MFYSSRREDLSGRWEELLEGLWASKSRFKYCLPKHGNVFKLRLLAFKIRILKYMQVSEEEDRSQSHGIFIHFQYSFTQTYTFIYIFIWILVPSFGIGQEDSYLWFTWSSLRTMLSKTKRWAHSSGQVHVPGESPKLEFEMCDLDWSKLMPCFCVSLVLWYHTVLGAQPYHK